MLRKILIIEDEFIVANDLQLTLEKGGYHVFGYMENSGAYYNNTPEVRQERDQQEIVQATLTLDISDKWRMETGGVSQYSRGGLPGGINRTTQELINTGKYWNGGFSYNMDLDNSGDISDYEILASYYGDGVMRPFGNTPGGQNLGRSGASFQSIAHSDNYLGQVNAPLYRRIPWQGGPVNGGTITMAQFLAGYTDTAGNARQGYQLMVYPTLANGMPNTSVAKQAYYLAAWDAGTRAVLAHGGALSHHHGVGLNRARFVAEALGPGADVLARLKQALDPAGILNPGKLGPPSPFGAPPWP